VRFSLRRCHDIEAGRSALRQSLPPPGVKACGTISDPELIAQAIELVRKHKKHKLKMKYLENGKLAKKFLADVRKDKAADEQYADISMAGDEVHVTSDQSLPADIPSKTDKDDIFYYDEAGKIQVREDLL